MSASMLAHLTDDLLLHNLHDLVARERRVTSTVLVHIGEVDARRLYAARACSSMFDYCVRVLGFSEDVACRRTRVARVGREFPDLLQAIDRGRLHLAGAYLIAPHMSAANAADLIEAAAGRSKAEIEHLLANRFPREDVATRVRALPTRGTAPAIVEPQVSLLASEADRSQPTSSPAAPMNAEDSADVPPVPAEPRPPAGTSVQRPHQLVPLAPRRYALQATLPQETHDKLRYAQKLLSHRVPSGDLARVLDRALDALIAQLEKQRFGATSRTRSRTQDAAARARGQDATAGARGQDATAGAPLDPRYIPRAVRRAVYARDEGRCTFVDASGRRCGSATFLEYDHVVPIARGGASTVENLRLRCRSHNLFAAERMFGVEFMKKKRRRASG